MNGKEPDEGIASFEVGGGEPYTPEADKFLEQAVKGTEDGKAEQPGQQPPEAGAKPADADKPTDEQQRKTPEADQVKNQEEPEDFDKIDKPSGENWKKAREALKAKEQRIRELEAAGAKPAPEAAKPADEPAKAGAPAKDDVSPEIVFDTLAKVVSGEETKFKRADVERYIQSRLTPVQVKDVIDAARDGRYGDASQEILALAQEQLPMVIASAEGNREREAQAAKLRGEREAAGRELVEAFPEIAGKDPENPVFKEVDAACRELEAVIPHFQNIPAAPRVVKQFVELKRKAASADALAKERDALKTENERLAKLVGQPAKPPAGGGAPEKPQESDADAWLLKQVEAGQFKQAAD